MGQIAGAVAAQLGQFALPAGQPRGKAGRRAQQAVTDGDHPHAGLAQRPADGGGVIRMGIAAAAIVDFEDLAGWASIGQRQQGARQIVDMDQADARIGASGRQAQAEPGQRKQVAHLGIARPIDAGWPHDHPVQPARHHQRVAGRLGRAIERQARLARGQAGDVDEARHMGGGGQHIGGARHIAGPEAGRISGIDHAGNVQHGRRAIAQPGQRMAVRQVAQHPFDAGLWPLRPPGEGAHWATRQRQHARADKAGGAGDGKGGAVSAHRFRDRAGSRQSRALTSKRFSALWRARHARSRRYAATSKG